MLYTLTIKRYDRVLGFNSLEDLRKEFSRYFSPREKASGVVECLTNFDYIKEIDGHKKITYKDFTLCYYPHNEKGHTGAFNSGLGCGTDCKIC